jgi:hypothetical protein
MADLASLTTPRLVSPRTFAIDVPDGWQQGRGAFGGFSIAVLVRAMEASEPAGDRSLRSLTVELPGPVLPGPASIAVEVLRRGSGVTTLAARLAQGDEVLAHAVGVLGKARADRPRRTFLAPPSPPPWRDLRTHPMTESSFGPPFARSFDMRNVGPEPFAGGPEAVTSGWVRARNPGPARDAAYLAAMADAWWPASFSMETALRPTATIAYTLEIVGNLDGLDPEAPLFHRAHVVAEHEGYVVEMRELWGEDGRLVALNQQTFAVIR